VLTFSVRESGDFLFPGTGFPEERGEGPGLGTSFNLPLPPDATDACYRLAFDKAIAPAVRAFGPDLIVLQAGADAHSADPLTSLDLTLSGYHWLVEHIVGLAEDLTGGRLVAFGGGGYAWRYIVPRAWALLTVALAGIDTNEKEPPPAAADERLLPEVEATIAELMSAPDGPATP